MSDPPASAPIRIELLHAPRLVTADGATHALERKDAALLALLVLDGATTAAHAAALLWPDSPERQARANLRQRLFRLRKLAGRDLVDADAGLQLAPGLALDLLEFAAALADDPQAGTGELLGGLDYGDTGALELWVGAARQRWRERCQDRLAARASELEAAHQIAAALVLAQRIVSADPLQEHAHRRLMRLHYLRGDRAAALAAYHQCRDTLRAELGAKPNHETEQLATLIEASGTLPQPAPAPRAIATLRPPRLCGRAGPWRRLDQAHHNAANVLIEGEAGIGKTRLLGDFAAAHGDAPVFGGRPGDASLPYALLARIVRGLADRYPPPAADWVLAELARVAPELGAAAPGQISALRLQQAVVHALTEWQAAGLKMLVVDDLHHADSATLELLPALTGGSREQPLAWLFGVRHAELPPAIARWLDAPEMHAVDRIALGPLDVDGVAALLESIALPGLDARRWAPALTRHTGGNPLFVLETLIAMLARPDGAALTTLPALAGEPPSLPAPERIGRLIERRLEQLSPSALKLARVAAVAGPDFSAAVAAEVLGLRALDIADAWRELESAAVIRDAAFAHDLIFEGTLRSIPAAIARLLHHEVAVALRTAGAPAARLAAHWAAAQDWAEAGTAYATAARDAYAASRRIEEARLWDEAVRCHELAGRRDLAFEARRDSIDTALATRTAESVLAMTATLLDGADDDAQRLDALLAHAKALMAAGRRSDAVAASDAALALARQHGGPQERFAAACLSAMVLSQDLRAAEGIERLRAFATWVETEGNAMQRRDYYCHLAVAAHGAGRRSEAAALYPLALAASRAAGDRSDEMTAMSNLGGLLTQLGRIEAGREQFERAVRLAEREGDAEGLPAAAAHLNLATACVALGRFDTALREFEMVLRKLGSGASGQHAVCENHMAFAWLQLGQPARALQVLKPIAADVVAQFPQRQARRLTIEARIDRALGRPALPRLELALQVGGPGMEPYVRMLIELDRSREIDPAEAAALCERVEHEARASELLAVAMRARVLAVEARRRAGDPRRAADMARDAASMWQHCRPADLYWPEALCIAHRALGDSGDEAAAQPLLLQAVDWIQRTALPHVPEPFRDSFLHRNAVNRDLLAAAARAQ